MSKPIQSEEAHWQKNNILASAVSAALAVSAPVFAQNFEVTVSDEPGNCTNPGEECTEGTLSWAIRSANATSGADTITLKTDVTVKGVMKNLINSDVTLQSDDTRRTISGDDKFRPFFIKSGNVTIKNINITKGLAKGGNSNRGGGGAGLGGALFVYDGCHIVPY